MSSDNLMKGDKDNMMRRLIMYCWLLNVICLIFLYYIADSINLLILNRQTYCLRHIFCKRSRKSHREREELWFECTEKIQILIQIKSWFKDFLLLFSSFALFLYYFYVLFFSIMLSELHKENFLLYLKEEKEEINI